MKSSLLFILLFFASLVCASTNPPSLQYARIFERELAGDVAGAVSDYRAFLSTLPPSEPVLAEKLLYRIGVGEHRLGHPETTRQIWRRLVQDYPARDPEVVRTREALKSLERELDRVTISGRVDYARGTGVAAAVFAGEWGDEPTILADTNGAFSVERKIAGQTIGGERYCLVFAEHPRLPLVAAEEAKEGRSQESGIRNSASNRLGVTIQLIPSLTLFGSVVDPMGRPMAGAAIQVMGFKSDIPFPFDRLLPPTVSATNGDFSVAGLVPGLRYVLTAVKPGCRMVTAAERDTSLPAEKTGESSASCGSIVLQKLGEVSLRGKIVDESGAPAQAEVAAWSLPPVDREVARVTTDPAGRFVFRDLRENGVTLKVEGDGFLSKSIIGLKPMGQDIDVVLRGNGLSARNPEKGARSKEAGEQQSVLTFESEDHDTLSSGRLPFSFMNFPAFPFPLPPCDFQWLRGNPESGAPVLARDLKGHVVVFHLGSAYVESALRAQYPGESSVLSNIMRLYGDSGVICLWVVPEGEARGDAARMALELYPELPVASLPRSGREAGGPGRNEKTPVESIWGVEHGNIVVGRDGLVRTLCSDQQLFKAVKAAITAKP